MGNKLTIEERLAIFRILYPSAEFDSLMESGHCNAEEYMNEFGIPTQRNKLIYVIGIEQPLKENINVVVKKYYEKYI